MRETTYNLTNYSSVQIALSCDQNIENKGACAVDEIKFYWPTKEILEQAEESGQPSTPITVDPTTLQGVTDVCQEIEQCR